VSGCYPFGPKESFYTIYTAFMRLIKNKDKIDEERYRKKVLNYAGKVRTLCDFFANFCSNPKEMLDSMRRREFSEKMAELIKRLDHISFTEHDYNKFIKQSKFFLESLDKEHYRYEL